MHMYISFEDAACWRFGRDRRDFRIRNRSTKSHI